MRGPITSDKEECLGNIKKLQVMSGNDMKMSQFESIYRTACRMWFLSLDKPLASQLFDPFQKKRDLAFEGWGKCFEVLQNYFQFFSHCCLWSNEEVHKMLVKMLQVFLLVPNGFQPEPLDPEKLSTTASQNTRKAAFPTTLRDAYEVNAQHLVGYLNTNDVNTIKIANDERFIRAQKAKNKNEAEKIKRLREQIAKAEALEAKKRKDDEEKERQRKIDEEAHALQALDEENRLRQESEAQREKKRKRDAILSKEARQELGDDQPRKFRRLRRARSKGKKRKSSKSKDDKIRIMECDCTGPPSEFLEKLQGSVIDLTGEDDVLQIEVSAATFQRFSTMNIPNVAVHGNVTLVCHKPNEFFEAFKSKAITISGSDKEPSEEEKEDFDQDNEDDSDDDDNDDEDDFSSIV
ncbi:hypothetical protein H257_05554 [Aphanomyces astaci]|uniref:Uncharacterized protein n=1 Tax=Aphanomyces astaci TaxID=112090 RepID=W4GT10_APHAT|nr:hypothetical protein H257_05554 [Aphanomyces astaci]ETV82028.1 hypothetical protein H257_05554 [Aphanomyces astaci]|eukprot:XP_009828765.1 hypothetical protein H257_05554 [Aphanomyces astaci]